MYVCKRIAKHIERNLLALCLSDKYDYVLYEMIHAGMYITDFTLLLNTNLYAQSLFAKSFLCLKMRNRQIKFE